MQTIYGEDPVSLDFWPGIFGRNKISVVCNGYDYSRVSIFKQSLYPNLLGFNSTIKNGKGFWPEFDNI